MASRPTTSRGLHDGARPPARPRRRAGDLAGRSHRTSSCRPDRSSRTRRAFSRRSWTACLTTSGRRRRDDGHVPALTPDPSSLRTDRAQPARRRRDSGVRGDGVPRRTSRHGSRLTFDVDGAPLGLAGLRTSRPRSMATPPLQVRSSRADRRREARRERPDGGRRGPGAGLLGRGATRPHGRRAAGEAGRAGLDVRPLPRAGPGAHAAPKAVLVKNAPSGRRAAGILRRGASSS